MSGAKWTPEEIGPLWVVWRYLHNNEHLYRNGVDGDSVAAFDAALLDLKLLAAAREQDALIWGAGLIEHHHREAVAKGNDGTCNCLARAAALRTLAAPPTEEDDGWTGER